VANDDLKILKLKAQIGVTAVLGFFSLGVLVYEPSENWLVKWAIGILGIIIGYWLK
jgi:hypothetical protein